MIINSRFVYLPISLVSDFNVFTSIYITNRNEDHDARHGDATRGKPCGFRPRQICSASLQLGRVLAWHRAEAARQEDQCFVLTRKLNSKIQAIAAKQTEIFVWTRKIAESQAEDLPLSPMILYCTCLTVQGFAWSEGRLYIYIYIHIYIHTYI